MRGDEKSVNDMNGAISTLKAEVDACQATFTELVAARNGIAEYVSTVDTLQPQDRPAPTQYSETGC